MTREELKNYAEELNIKVTSKMNKATIEDLIAKAESKKAEESKKKEERENKKMTEKNDRCAEFEYLVNVLNKNNIMIVNETDRRVTTAKAMFCKRKNKVRAYIKMKTYKELENEVTNVTDRNTQYVAYIDININDYAEAMIKKICE